MAGLDLAELVDQKVALQLAEMNGRLEQLVADAVDRELDRLVATQLAAKLELRAAANGTGTASAAAGDAEAVPDDVPATKRCSRCRKTKPLSEFRHHRNVCRRCGKEQERERQARRKAQPVEAAPPDPSSGATSTS